MLIHDPYRMAPLGVESASPTPVRVDAASRSALPMIQLKRGMLLRVSECAGRIVTAHSGSVWITEQGSQHDVVLRSGESFKLTRQGVALVEAFGDASIAIDRTCATQVLPL